MNSLSWIIYAAEVVDNLRNAGMAVLLIGGFVALFSGIPVTVGAMAGFSDANEKKFQAMWLRWFHRWLWAAAVSVAVIVFVPTQRTVYMLVTSEIGVSFAKSDAVSGIAADAQAVLKLYLKHAREALEPPKIKDRAKQGE